MPLVVQIQEDVVVIAEAYETSLVNCGEACARIPRITEFQEGVLIAYASRLFA